MRNKYLILLFTSISALVHAQTTDHEEPNEEHKITQDEPKSLLLHDITIQEYEKWILPISDRQILCLHKPLSNTSRQ